MGNSNKIIYVISMYHWSNVFWIYREFKGIVINIGNTVAENKIMNYKKVQSKVIATWK